MGVEEAGIIQRNIKVAIMACCLISGNGYAQDSNSLIVDVIKPMQLGAEKIKLLCDRPKLERKIDQKRTEMGSSEYETMLSYARRDDGDGYSQLMSNKSLRDHFIPGTEGAVFISQDFKMLAVAKFSKSANVNTFLKAVSACSKVARNICVPALYYDGADTFCLLFTKDELSR